MFNWFKKPELPKPAGYEIDCMVCCHKIVQVMPPQVIVRTEYRSGDSRNIFGDCYLAYRTACDQCIASLGDKQRIQLDANKYHPVYNIEPPYMRDFQSTLWNSIGAFRNF